MSVIRKNFSKTSAKSNSKAVSTAKSGNGKLNSIAIEEQLKARHEQLLAQGYSTTYGGRALPQTGKWSDRLIASPNGEVMKELDAMFDADLANAERVRLTQAREKREAKRAEKRTANEAARQARLDAEREKYARSSKEERLAKQAEHEKMLRECRTKYGITEQVEKAVCARTKLSPDDYVIRDDTMFNLAVSATLKALRLLMAYWGKPRVFELYYSVLSDVHRHMGVAGVAFGDGMDLVNEAVLIFARYKKAAEPREVNSLQELSDCSVKRNGEKRDIYGEAVYAVQRIVVPDVRKSTKLTYLEDLDENGHPIYLSVDSNLQISSVDELEYFDEAIDELCSSNNKREHDTLEKTLIARLGGYSIHQIAKKRHTAPSQVRKTMRKLQKRAYELGYPVPKGYIPEGYKAEDKPE